MSQVHAEILIVDDISANLQVLAAVLVEGGYKVRPANNGRMALNAVRAALPDLILLDIKMPEMDGYEVCRRLKADVHSRNIPVIFISALNGTDEKLLGFEAGAVDFLTKPFQPQEVLARVNAHLALYHAQHQLQQANAQLQAEVARRIQTEAELQHRQRGLILLNDITRTAAEATDLKEMLQVFANHFGSLFDASGCFITQWDAEKRQVLPLAAYGSMAESYLSFQPGPGELTATESVLNAGHALAIADVFNTTYLSLGIAKKFPTRSMLALPLTTKDALENTSWLGAILVSFEQPHHFTAEETALGEQAARQISLAIARTNLLEETSRRASEFAALHETAQAIAGETDLSSLLALIVDRAMHLLSPMAGAIFLLDTLRDELEIVVSTDPTIPIGTRMAVNQGLAGRVVRERQPVMVNDYSNWEGKSAIFAQHSIRAVVEAPLLFSGELLGVIFVYEKEDSARQYTQEDIHLLDLFASQAAAAVHSARLLSETRSHLGELNRFSTALRAVTTSEEMLPRLLDETLRALHVIDGGIWIKNARKEQFDPLVVRGVLASNMGYSLGTNGLTGQILADHQPFVTREAASDARFPEKVRSRIPQGFGGALIPIRAAQEDIGFLMVVVSLPREIAPEESRFLATLAEMVGSAIHRMRLHDLTDRRLHDLQSLRDIDRAIGSSLDVNITLGILLEQSIARLKIDAASVLLYQPEEKMLQFAAGRGFRTAALQHTRLKLGEGYAGVAALEQRVVHTLNLPTRKTDFLRSPFFAEEGFISGHAVPLIAKGEVKGVLEVFHRSLVTVDEEWLDILGSLATQAAIALDNASLFQNLQRSNQELAKAYDTTIEGLARALEIRERETGEHTRRVTTLTVRLARSMGMSESEVAHVRRGALLHDIGKMGVPDNILLKPGALTPEEWVTMRQHPQLAYDMLSPIEYLRPALEIPYCHHEKWDGTGYPRGLKGEEIPQAARIFSVVDVWDALTSNRPYRAAMKPDKAIAYIKEQSGKFFEPKVVSLFTSLVFSAANSETRPMREPK
jgi:putative nucleotidyltransferase with HDIG domain